MDQEIAGLITARQSIHPAFRVERHMLVEPGEVTEHVFDRVLFPFRPEMIEPVTDVSEVIDSIQKSHAPVTIADEECRCAQAVEITPKNQIASLGDQVFGPKLKIHN